MVKVTIFLLLIVPVFGRKRDYNLKETSSYNPSIPISHSGGSTVLRPNDVRLVKVVNFLIDRINSYFNHDDDALKLLKIGKVELKVLDDHQHHFIKNIFTFEKILCISRDGLEEVYLHGSISITYDQDGNFVKDYIFVNHVPRNYPVLLKDAVRRKSISAGIDEEKNANPQRRHSLNLEMDQDPNTEE